MLSDSTSAADDPDEMEVVPTIGPPHADDGARLWRLAHAAGELDVNSPYHYVLWCRDFAATTVVARAADRPIGFVTAYRRPDAPDTLFVWQIAVHPDARRQGLARRMLDHLGTVMRGLGCRYLELTITPANTASVRTFRSFARAHDVPMAAADSFGAELFPEEHEPEQLFRLGPFRVPAHAGV